MQAGTTQTTEDIEIHIRTYRSLLKSAGEVNISQLVDSHLRMDSILHEKGQSPEVDVAAFIYTLLRLPPCMSNVKTVILGQSFTVFKNNGYPNMSSWREVDAPGRRRKMFYDGKSTLAVYIASVSDVDDIITLLTGFQIEWNKFHHALAKAKDLEGGTLKLLGEELTDKIKKIWGSDFSKFLYAIKKRQVDVKVKLLSGSYMEYAKATHHWWEHITHTMSTLDLEKRPIYFTSSNTHSIINVATQFALTKENEIIEYLHTSRSHELITLWDKICSGEYVASREYFLYYVAKKYAKAHPEYTKQKAIVEKRMGVHTISALHYLDIDAQVIELSKLAKESGRQELRHLVDSSAIIINIDYPLGWAAYLALTQIGRNVDQIKGVYIMGKAASLNGQIGDILIPTTMYDQHTRNMYIISNAFTAKDFSNKFRTGLVIDNLKTISVKGTFLQNRKVIEEWYREGYATIEMESGPYLNAVYEFVYYNRYEENQFINLVNTPFELGIVHYASDTPYSKASNLGVRNLSYDGVEATYSISEMILQKIIEAEK